MPIEILDCTLRDGGYTIDWMFGRETIQLIAENLASSKINYIECGFLKECDFDEDKTFFNSPEELKNVVLPGQNYTLMVNYGEYPVSKFGECKDKNIKIRTAFKKHNQKDALDYIRTLTNLGWDVFANPMSTNTYSETELASLLEEINQIKPYGLSIVDTLGNMYEKDVQEIFEFIDKRLNPEISLGFHSHNSLQLSFSNTKTLLKMGINRNIIVDSCVYGMGRGAGNLCTELIIKYLNDSYDGNYKILPVLKIIEKLKPFYEKHPWGYSTPYYIAAMRGCHPNYAGYLCENNFSDEKIDRILSKIPADKKTSFDKNLLLALISEFTVHS